ncbi:hypothetical protein QVD17_11039 [Tagetes erecta]|uniref:VQ domain-containing protein n=1 Tax=Tagetes erecta TaxID=13708 RepID=A0AAD8L7Q1_TARER|nr:hypothetical protein QVD17_11039 [Tagetes erecta]
MLIVVNCYIIVPSSILGSIEATFMDPTILCWDHFDKIITTTTTTTTATTTYKFISPKMQNSPTTTIHHPSPPPTPITISDPNNPYPTTFVQADTTSFKTVVQMLTGSSETVKHAGRPDPSPARNLIPPIKTNPNKKPSKLYERRNSLKNFKISPLILGFTNSGGFSSSPLCRRVYLIFRRWY